MPLIAKAAKIPHCPTGLIHRVKVKHRSVGNPGRKIVDGNDIEEVPLR
jgi:hypothetical protein